MTNTLAALPPAPARRWMSTGLIFTLAVIFLSLAATAPTFTLIGRLLVAALGLSALWVALISLRSHHLGLVLTDQGLHDSDGQMIARVEDMHSVDRSAFAFKPSNGFMLRLNTPAPRRWVPGLYWSIGDRLAIGGATNPADTRTLADKIAFLLAEQQTNP